MSIKITVFASILAITLLCSALPIQSAMAMSKTPSEKQRPNILLIVADDLGYTDLGSFGGEIDTPNLDKLADNGLKLTSFYVAPTCSPTRAMLMSGADSHVAGLGNMAEELAPNQKGQLGYEGYLNKRVAALPELLRDAGYKTYMTGKWHLGKEVSNSPAARGFDRSYAPLEGGAGHFNSLPIVGPGKARYREDGRLVDDLPENFYSTRFYVDKMIDYLKTNKDDGRPFFAYLAFSAPHWPLQAPESSIRKYQGRYDSGYDVLYERRIKGLQARGMMPDNAQGQPRLDGEKAWDDLTRQEQKTEARKMEIYAAMVDDIDVHTGRLLGYLDSIDQLNNTLIVFLSDNGAEGHHLEDGWPALQQWVVECCDNSYLNMGKANSYIWYGPNWARAGSGPFRLFKGFTSEGGIRVPAFIHYSGFKRQGEVSDAVVSVRDVMPTLLDIAAIRHPGATYKGRQLEPMTGKSLLPLLQGQSATVHDKNAVLGWELFAKRAIRQGDWKITLQAKPYGSGEWQLYNLKTDPSEQKNLAAKAPGKLRSMERLWEQYARKNGVIIPDRVSGY